MPRHASFAIRSSLMSEHKAASPARTRFAPSPTGFLHIGSLRTVLYNWLLARGTGGQFLLRIEDTDRNRYVPGAEEQVRELDSGKSYVLRIAVPLEGETVCNDYLRGPIVVAKRTLSDLVLLKGDGYPTYHLAAIVDDHEMHITHVLRADEWIPTFPIHVLLYQFLGWEQPIWAHMPQVLGPDGRKLSKRHGDTSITDYLERGYLVEAITNCLAMIGWGYDETTELMTREDLIERFSLDRVSPSGGVFSIDKLNWFNGIYIRKLSVPELTDKLIPYMQRAGLIGTPASASERTYVQQLTPLIQERLVILSEAPDLLGFFFQAPQHLELNELVPKKLDPAGTLRALNAARSTLAEAGDWSEGELETRLRALAEELGLKTGDLFMALRVATTGSKVSPPLFQTLHALGRDEVLRRIDFAADRLQAVEA